MVEKTGMIIIKKKKEKIKIGNGIKAGGRNLVSLLSEILLMSSIIKNMFNVMIKM